MLGPDRRQFLRGCARSLLLGGLVTLGFSVTRSPSDPDFAAECDRDGLCGGCARFTACSLPPAQAKRQTHAGGPS